MTQNVRIQISPKEFSVEYKMTDDIQLADLLEAYPPTTDPDFQQKITDKYEFSSLASSVSERPPKAPKRYYKHQELTHRFLRQYDDLCILSETGTGKTTEVLGFTEMVRDQVLLAAIHPEQADEKLSHFRQVIVLVKGENQANELNSQLVCKISQGRYLTEQVLKATDESSQKRAVKIAVKKWYHFTTYQKFVNNIERKYNTLEAQIQQYSDTIFWIDEAHNLIVDEDDAAATSQKERTTQLISHIFHNVPRCKRIISSATPMINGVEDIRTLMNLLLPIDMPIHYNFTALSDPSRRWERKAFFPGVKAHEFETMTYEQARQLYRGQIPPGFITQCADDPEGLEKVEPYFRSRLSFVRALDTGAIPVFRGVPLKEAPFASGEYINRETVVYPTPMSEYQQEIYDQVPEGTFSGPKRQASNFIFPDGTFGNSRNETRKAEEYENRKKRKLLAKQGAPETNVPNIRKRTKDLVDIDNDIVEIEEAPVNDHAYGLYVKTTPDGDFTVTDAFSSYLRNHENIRRSSSKFHAICESVTSKPGNCFVYGEYVSGSGITVLAACLEAYGMKRFTENTSVFTTIGGSGPRPYCSSTDRTGVNRIVKDSYKRKTYNVSGNYTYALLHRGTPDARALAMFEAMNSPENKDGNLIKVLIASRVGRDGINVNNVLQIHLIGPEWTPGAMYQAISRGVRSTSHEDLLGDERKRLIKRGIPPENARIEIEIFLHASYSQDTNSIDYHMYKAAEDKARSISRIMRYCKQISNTCRIHHNRNVRVTDIDGSAACDYDDCAYSCYQESSGDIDYSTYDIRYADEIIDMVALDLLDTFNQVNAMPFEDICKHLPNFRPKYIGMALEKLITSKTPIVDRFGYVSYLQEDAGGFYLDRSYPTGNLPSYDLSVYTTGILGLHTASLKATVIRIDQDSNLVSMKLLEKYSLEELPTVLKTFPFTVQIRILEEALLADIQGKRNEYIDTVINLYQWFIFEFHEPVRQISTQKTELTTIGTIGRPKTNTTGKKIKLTANRVKDQEAELAQDTKNELVYIHTMYSTEPGGNKYDEVPNYLGAGGVMRIFKPSEGLGWRDVDRYEAVPYNRLAQAEIIRRFEPYNAQPYYGTVINGYFRIVNKRKQLQKQREAIETKGINPENNAKNDFNGKECSSWEPEDLFDCIYELNLSPPTMPSRSLSQETKIKQIGDKYPSLKEALKTYPPDRINMIHAWIMVPSNVRGKTIGKKETCPYIMQGLRDNNLLIEIS